ncbi:ATP-binding protein [Catellatospora sichuanensis]|uniref:ATP-binding protein n=1 Tax=Catellatospora sichuanensis TaxID=1969805 RepID=UPI0011839858|nr:ATP-binding protein [Catellatospora sichuanensis]
MPVELAVLIGLQAAGKSTFCRTVLADGRVVVSKDDFPNARHRQRRQMRLVGEALVAGRSVVVDNTNPSPAQWQPLVDAAREHGATVVGYWFPPDPAGSAARNAARDDRTRVPDAGLRAVLRELRRPCRADGFDRLYTVGFDGAGGFRVDALDEEA